MLRKYFLLVFFLLFAGCSVYGPEELDRLTKEDPHFKQMIIARDQLHAQMSAIKADMLTKKQAMDAQMDKFRNEYDAYAKLQNQKIEKCQALIDASRNLLKKEIETAEASMEAKRMELAGYSKTLADVRNLLRASKGITFSSQEKLKWDEKILLLSEKIRPLKDEIEDLNLQVRLKKSKISFLH